MAIERDGTDRTYAISYDRSELVLELTHNDNGFTHDLEVQMDAALASVGKSVHGDAYVLGERRPDGGLNVTQEGVVMHGYHMDRRFELGRAREMAEIGLLPAGRVSIGAGQGDGELFAMTYTGKGYTVTPTWSGKFHVAGPDGKRVGWYSMAALRKLLG